MRWAKGVDPGVEDPEVNHDVHPDARPPPRGALKADRQRQKCERQRPTKNRHVEAHQTGTDRAQQLGDPSGAEHHGTVCPFGHHVRKTEAILDPIREGTLVRCAER